MHSGAPGLQRAYKRLVALIENACARAGLPVCRGVEPPLPHGHGATGVSARPRIVFSTRAHPYSSVSFVRVCARYVACVHAWCRLPRKNPAKRSVPRGAERRVPTRTRTRFGSALATYRDACEVEGGRASAGLVVGPELSRRALGHAWVVLDAIGVRRRKLITRSSSALVGTRSRGYGCASSPPRDRCRRCDPNAPTRVRARTCAVSGTCSTATRARTSTPMARVASPSSSMRRARAVCSITLRVG